MKLATGCLILWLSLGGGLAQSDTPRPDTEESYTDWGLRHLRGSFESVNSYFDSFQELLGGKNGICQYRCRYGKPPMPRPDYKPQEPNGCGSYFLGLKVPESVCTTNTALIGFIETNPALSLMETIIQQNQVEQSACDSLVDTVFNTVWTLGCRPFMNSQRAACICAEEEKEEL
ncbi:PREDICTED: group XIIB secretory phospholipase A2-like protein [Elephantulus edwardii]|uniref:group XIIB secretory phospholipase A2-like protein n=1 Tax=Elephantulus edwardii TaxID=28737 RepID=UPI0003F080C5|nr:PREDICTED: group XIIB secretory phospholipase A2-like protein [Elephantulus edwardii]